MVEITLPKDNNQIFASKYQTYLPSKEELKRLIEENKLLQAKTKALESAEDMKELYAEAIKAMASYQGHGGPEDEDDY